MVDGGRKGFLEIIIILSNTLALKRIIVRISSLGGERRRGREERGYTSLFSAPFPLPAPFLKLSGPENKTVTTVEGGGLITTRLWSRNGAETWETSHSRELYISRY